MRLLGWLSKLLVSVLLISVLSIFTTIYMVDLYINRFLDQWNIGETLETTIDPKDYVSKLLNPSQIWDDETNDSGENEEIRNDRQTTTDEDPALPVFNQGNMNNNQLQEVLEGTTRSTQGSSQGNSQNTQNGVGSSTEGAEAEGAEESTLERGQGSISEDKQESARGSTLPPTSNSSDLKDKLVMSAQEFNETRKKLTNQDKTAIFSIVMTKLPQKELQKMSQLLEDGITEEELADLVDVINAYLEQEEVNKLLAILNKY